MTAWLALVSGGQAASGVCPALRLMQEAGTWMTRCELQALVSPLPEVTRWLSDPEDQQEGSPGGLAPILSPGQGGQLPEKQLKIESKQLSRVWWGGGRARGPGVF